jgi:hypothetical protein
MRTFIVGLALLVTTAAIQAPDQTDTNPDIVVDGRRYRSSEIDQAFRAIAEPESLGGFDGQYARWSTPICLQVVGLPKDGAQLIADQLASTARHLGVKVQGAGCAPNIFIIATADPQKMVRQMRQRRQFLMIGEDVAHLDAIEKSHDAVRWVGYAEFRGIDGERPGNDSYGTLGSYPTLSRFDGGSRLESSSQAFLGRMTIIMDAKQITGVSYGQLAAYLDMVTLGRLRPHAVPQTVRSILSLFPTTTEAPAGLTSFDRAYLQGLYRMDPHLTGEAQASDFKHAVNLALRNGSSLDDMEP